MALYLYLKEEWHVESWVNGGKVPLNLASNYVGNRRGIMTPDEMKIAETWGISGAAQRELVDWVQDTIGSTRMRFSGDITLQTDSGSYSLDGSYISTEQKNALIICLSRSLSKSLMRKFRDAEGNCKKAVVEIIDPRKLYAAICSQIESASDFDNVEYTNTARRNCFLKSKEDQWQHEVRMAWYPELMEPREVMIPPGIAREINLNDIPDYAYEPVLTHNSDYDLKWGHLDNVHFASPSVSTAPTVGHVTYYNGSNRAERRADKSRNRKSKIPR